MSYIDELSLAQVEAEKPQGLSSHEILELFAHHQVSLSEATLRKYVQLGLLPRSVRVGEKGKHRGSKGLYPVRVVRQILLIKQMMAQNYTIEQIQTQFLFIRGELEELDEKLQLIFQKVSRKVSEQRLRRELSVARDLNTAKGLGRDLVARLRSLESRLSSTDFNVPEVQEVAG